MRSYVSGDNVKMNATPPPHAPPQQQIQANLPAGVENFYVTYDTCGRRHIIMTLLPEPRRKLMAYAVFQLIFGPLIVILTSVAIALQHYYVAYGYASGILVSTCHYHHVHMHLNNI